jgi:D-hydroxyproline dehydrogenase subunit gamma
MSVPQFKRLKSTGRSAVEIRIDGTPRQTLAGDTVLTALLLAGRRVRQSDIDPGWRAGFCLMGACQDCWVWLEDGGRVRACTTVVEPGMSVLTSDPDLTR